ncbi:MAG TPA: hypothetical protein VFO40_15630 [Chthoniobacterales bacterium]|nr:hypothetical protein [Chthoniobacterales bacterium]
MDNDPEAKANAMSDLLEKLREAGYLEAEFAPGESLESFLASECIFVVSGTSVAKIRNVWPRVSEPYWMQDVRLAQRKIEAKRKIMSELRQWAREQQIESYVCPHCGMISHNPNDVTQRYCGLCHRYG